MERFPVKQLGGVGVNPDIPPHALAPGVWTRANNCRCDRGRVRPFSGHKSLTSCTGTFYFLLPVQGTTNYYWYHCSTTAIKEWDGTNCTDRTNVGGAYTGSATDRWNGGVLNGIPVLNNGVDAPQYLAAPGAGTFAHLTWDASDTWDTKGVEAKVIRVWRDMLVALDITESGSRDPQMFWLSDPAAAGAVPATWDPADASALVYKKPLADTSGRLIDCSPLGRDLIVYKEDAIYRVSYVGAPDVVTVDLITDKYGLRAQGCVVDVGGAHIVLGHNGVFMHNGSTITPLAYGMISETLFGDINGSQYEQSFLVSNPLEYEVWVCYPDQMATTWPNKAWVLNHKDKTWVPRDLPSETAYIVPGVDLEDAGTITFDTATGTIDTATGTFDDRQYNPTVQTLHGVAGSSFYKFDTGQQFAGVDPTCFVERTGLSLVGEGRLQKVIGILPLIEGTVDLNVYVGGQEEIDGSVTWFGPFVFDPASDRGIYPYITSQYTALRFESTDASVWALTGYIIEYVDAGVK